jgi:hypothetical protein
MADKPILFSGPMVRALIAGTKTQTRRTIKWNDDEREPPYVARYVEGARIVWCDGDDIWTLARSHAVGDRLYVRENLAIKSNDQDVRWLGYAADGKDVWPLTKWDRGTKGIPSIHAPRWTSRITLTVTDVRVERLQDISEADAVAEGMTQATADAILSAGELQVYATTHIVAPQARGRILYETIWDQINGEGAWAKNPWVAAYTFTVQMGNIDQLEAA